MRIRIIAMLAVTMAAVSCGQRKDSTSLPRPFPQVQVPAMVTDREEAASYLAEHYWDEFTDTSVLYPCDSQLVNGVRKTDLEQMYANWLAILDMVPLEEAAGYAGRLFRQISSVESRDTSSTVFETMTDYTQKYLYDPNSPFRNEDIYLPFVKAMSTSPYIPDGKKPGYEYDAQMCALNQVGTKAADFVFCDRNGRRYSLYGIKAEYIILFFSNPGCTACKEIIDELESEPHVKSMIESGRLAVLNIYIDSDLAEWRKYMPIYPDSWYNGYDPDYAIRTGILYNVRAIPSLYLLDKDKTVLMKDVPQERLFLWLRNIPV